MKFWFEQNEAIGIKNYFVSVLFYRGEQSGQNKTVEINN